MKIYSFKRIQLLPTTMTKAWDFFSTPKNLAKLTPADITFKILYVSGGEKVYAGQIIRYKITLLPGMKVNWLTEITHVKDYTHFIDEQRFGPYAFWHHQHHFKEVAEGVEMTDEVSYAIPLGFIGRMANWFFVERKLNAIFEYRHKAIENLFSNEKNIPN